LKHFPGKCGAKRLLEVLQEWDWTSLQQLGTVETCNRSMVLVAGFKVPSSWTNLVRSVQFCSWRAKIKHIWTSKSSSPV